MTIHASFPCWLALTLAGKFLTVAGRIGVNDSEGKEKCSGDDLVFSVASATANIIFSILSMYSYN